MSNQGAIMQELKPVAFMSTDRIGERFLCFSRPNDNDKCEDLYALPATHRIVPVELLEVWERAMRYERFGEHADGMGQQRSLETTDRAAAESDRVGGEGESSVSG